MSEDIYEHSVQFIPKGIPPHKASSIKTVTFCQDSLDKEEIKSNAQDVATNQRKIDPYALRNHWVVFNTEVSFHNPPWTTYQELCEEMMSHPTAASWKNVNGYLYIKLNQSDIQDFIDYAEDYYSGLNPRQYEPGIVLLEATPKYS